MQVLLHSSLRVNRVCFSLGSGLGEERKGCCMKLGSSTNPTSHPNHFPRQTISHAPASHLGEERVLNTPKQNSHGCIVSTRERQASVGRSKPGKGEVNQSSCSV